VLFVFGRELPVAEQVVELRLGAVQPIERELAVGPREGVLAANHVSGDHAFDPERALPSIGAFAFPLDDEGARLLVERSAADRCGALLSATTPDRGAGDAAPSVVLQVQERGAVASPLSGDGVRRLCGGGQ